MEVNIKKSRTFQNGTMAYKIKKSSSEDTLIALPHTQFREFLHWLEF